MPELTDATQDLVPTSAPPPSGKPRWVKVVAGGLAAAVGIVGAALVSDGASADSEERVEPTATARPVPVLASGPVGSALSTAVSQYAVAAFSDPTRGLVLGAWGAVFADLLDDGDVPPPPEDASDLLLDDPRVSEEGESGFVDPCAGAEPPDDCPSDDDATPAEVLGEEPLGPNVAFVFAFPAPDARYAEECAFADVQANELPIAAITTNPGELEVRIGDEVVTVTSEDAEIAEFDAYRDDPVIPRPVETYVAHCLAVPLPTTTSPVRITVAAVDDADQPAFAETTITPGVGGRPPATITPLDGTLVRVDVPLPDGSADAQVRAVPVSAFGAATPDCAAFPPVALGPAPAWRTGTSLLGGAPAAPGERPYLADAPRLRRVTLPLPEGEPSLVCITAPDGTAEVTTGLVATPPDARRLDLAVTEVDADADLGAGAVRVQGAFPALGWVPCLAVLPATTAGSPPSNPGDAGRLCSSGGDAGAIAAAGGVLDVSVTVGAASHLVRVPLSATPGGVPVESYRLPIPAPGLEGILCTPGVDQPGCVPPEGDAVLGTLVVTATWQEGPAGPTRWTFTSVPTAPILIPGS